MGSCLVAPSSNHTSQSLRRDPVLFMPCLSGPQAISIDAENGKSASAGPNSGMHRPYVHAVSVAVASGRRGTHDVRTRPPAYP